MSKHIGKVCSKAFRGLYNIRQVRKYLSEDSTKTLIHAFVTSHEITVIPSCMVFLNISMIVYRKYVMLLLG